MTTNIIRDGNMITILTTMIKLCLLNTISYCIGIIYAVTIFNVIFQRELHIKSILNNYNLDVLISYNVRCCYSLFNCITILFGFDFNQYRYNKLCRKCHFRCFNCWFNYKTKDTKQKPLMVANI